MPAKEKVNQLTGNRTHLQGTDQLICTERVDEKLKESENGPVISDE